FTRLDPVTVKIGQGVTFEVKVRRIDLEGPVEVSFDNLPPGVTVNPIAIPWNAESSQATVEAGRDLNPGKGEVPVVASSGGFRVEGKLKLALVLPKLELSLPGDVSLRAGKAVTAKVAVKRDGYQGPITIQFDDWPQGVSATKEIVIADAADEVD